MAGVCQVFCRIIFLQRKKGEKRMTKFDVYADKIAEKRQARLDEGYNAYLAARLRTKTHEEVVAELLGGLTVVLGVGNIFAERREKTLIF